MGIRRRAGAVSGVLGAVLLAAGCSSGTYSWVSTEGVQGKLIAFLRDDAGVGVRAESSGCLNRLDLRPRDAEADGELAAYRQLNNYRENGKFVAENVLTLHLGPDITDREFVLDAKAVTTEPFATTVTSEVVLRIKDGKLAGVSLKGAESVTSSTPSWGMGDGYVTPLCLDGTPSGPRFR